MAEEHVVRVILLGDIMLTMCMTGNRILGRDVWDRRRGVPRGVRLEISRSVHKCLPGPHALLLVVPGQKALKHEYDWSAAREHVELLGGARVWAHTLVLFCCRSEQVRLCLEEEGKSLVREKCGGRYHVLNIKNSDKAQVTKLLEKIMTMVEGHGGTPLNCTGPIPLRYKWKQKPSWPRAVCASHSQIPTAALLQERSFLQHRQETEF
ncbi:hypothetical protein AAFF_G00164850 [Aldrovandia affinis]|uniref:AIG1-type G domain-containing protein n=1 Tax=Aldrovandia affinis TaxID=143900 RepID=A0AAD7RM75_9TELE|nr:hypothetical protein AAFF_G00164850 [Aldrovandia affinis]